MKKNLPFIIVLLISQFTLFSQSVNWLNPKPSGEDFFDIAFSDAQHGWMVGTNGAVFYTSDTGHTWQALTPFTNQRLLQIVFINSTKMLIMGETSLFISNDGGYNWNTLCDISPSNFSKITFTSSNNGFALITNENGQKAFAKSTDGGASWTILQQPVDWNDFDASSETEIMAVADLNILKSTDGGISFQNIYSENQSRTWHAILYVSNNCWIAAGYTNNYGEARILRTTDDGINWNVIYLDKSAYLEHLGKNQEGLIFSYGYLKYFSKGVLPLFYSTDTGETWQTDYIGGWIMGGYNENYRVNSVWYINENQAFAYTSNDCTDNEPDFGRMNMLIQKNGSTFQPFRDNFSRSILDIAWDENEGLHVNTKYLMRSRDNGLSWTPLYSSNGDLLKKVIKIPQTSHLFVIGEYNLGKSVNGSEMLTNIYHSSDDGTNWTKTVSAMPIYVSDLNVFGTGDAYLFGRKALVVWKKNSRFYEKELGRAQLFKSRDMTQNWDEVSIPLDTMANMQFLNADTGFIFGGGGTTQYGGYYISTDNGLTWSYHSLGLPTIASGQMLSNTLGFVVTDESPARVYRFYTTSNQSELIFTADSSESIADIAFSGALTGYVLCQNSAGSNLYFTQDGGQSWNYSGTYPYINKLKVFSNLNGFAYGSAGRLLKLQDGFPVGLSEPGTPVTRRISVHPNPGDELVWLNLQDLRPAFPLKLKLLDGQGKVVVSRQINTREELSKPLSVSGLCNGLYLVSLISPEGNYEGRLLILHKK